MTRTHTAPWDYERRHAMPPDDLFDDCPACGYRLAVKHNGLISCYKCNTLDQVQLSPEERAKKAACSICTLSKAMRVCLSCAFREYRGQHLPQTVGEQVLLAYGESDLSRELAEQNEWLNGWEPEQTKYVKLSYGNRADFEIHRNGKIRYYHSVKYYGRVEQMTRPVMFSGGLRALP